jgi:hypothetical protein
MQNARERNLTSATNFCALKRLARWDFLGYPQVYPAITCTGAISTGTTCCALIRAQYP